MAAPETVNAPATGPRRRRRWPLSVAALGLLGLTLLYVAVWRHPAPPSAGDGPQMSTTTISRQNLTEVATVPADLGFGPPQTVESRLTGTVTALAGVGSVVNRGHELFRVDDMPVVLMYGTLPAYRDLTAGHPAGGGAPGTTGPGTGGATATDPGAGEPAAAVPATKGADVRQFEANLKALGYSGFTVDETYTDQTAQAVRRWQKDLGLEQTGVVELGRVIYRPGPVRVAKHEVTVGSQTGGPVLTTTGTARLVTAHLPQRDQALARVNAKVTVVLSSGREIPGTVQSVAASSGDSASGGDSAGTGQESSLDAVVSLDDPDQAADAGDGLAQVEFTVQQRKDVLAVPVGALLALAEGGYGLQILDGRSWRIVAVTTGLFADGKVEVSGPELRAGLTVGLAQ
jgi:membrane fusion protein, multidrug efflux system